MTVSLYNRKDKRMISSYGIGSIHRFVFAITVMRLVFFKI